MRRVKRASNVPATTAATRLHLREGGAGGRTVILLHGLGGTGRYWAHGTDALAARHRLLAVDLLGFGASPRPRSRYTVDQHVEAMAATLRGNDPVSGNDPVICVGHSMGAVLALAYAARYPDRVERLVLLSLPHFGSRQSALAHFRRAPRPLNWLLTHRTAAAVGCVLSRRIPGAGASSAAGRLPADIVRDLRQHTWRSFTSSLWEVIYQHDAAADADQLPDSLPVHLVHGDADRTAPVHGAVRLARDRANWSVQILPGVDHHPLLRAPEAVLSAISHHTP